MGSNTLALVEGRNFVPEAQKELVAGSTGAAAGAAPEEAARQFVVAGPGPEAEAQLVAEAEPEAAEPVPAAARPGEAAEPAGVEPQRIAGWLRSARAALA